MSNSIRYIDDKDGNHVLPVTHERAVKDSSGVNLETKLAGKENTISDLATIRSGAAAGATAYQKPASGIPKSDLASGVQTSLDFADSSLQYTPSGAVDPTITPATYATNEQLDELEAKVTDFYGPRTKLSYNSEDATSLIKADGTIETDAQYFARCTVLHYTAQRDRIYNLQFTAPGVGTPYICGAAYKNGSPVLLFEPFYINTITVRNYLISTVGIDVDEIIVSVRDGYKTDTILAESPMVSNQEDDNTNIAYGVYTLLTRTSYTAKSAIKADGTIETSPQYMNPGQISRFVAQTDRVYKIHFTVPQFSSDYRAIALYKNGSPIKAFAPLNGTKHLFDCVVDTRGIDIDEIVIGNATTPIDEPLIAESAVQLYVEGVASSITSIYSPLAGMDAYTLSQESGKFGLIPRIYIEGLAKSDDGTKVTINGGNSLIVEHPDYVNTANTTHPLGFDVAADGFASMRDSIRIHKHAPANAKNKSMRIMCIGDSLTDAGYSGVVEFIFKALNQDYGNSDISALMVGTMKDAATLSLGDYSFAVRGCNEGRSGWAISDYLRHFNIVTANKTQWDMLGLGTMSRNGVQSRTYVAYTGTDEQKELMRTTCHGWYDADPSQELWSWLKTNAFANIFANPFVYDGVTYDLGSSYSSATDPAIIAAVKYICEAEIWKPCPFYDYDTVQSSNGAYAFSLSKYLARYKTLSNDGVTRLVIGSTAGNLVEDVNYNDVCEPTHIVIIMNENDARWTSSGTVAADDMKLCAELIEDYNNAIKVAIGSTRGYGAFNPSEYSYFGYVGNFYHNTRRNQTWDELRTILSGSNFDLLPLYVMQSPIGVGGGRAFDTLDQKEKVNMVGDRLHTGEGAMSYLDRAYLVAAWVVYTLS